MKGNPFVTLQRDEAAHLEDVLGHAREAVVSHAGATGAHADLSDLVRLAEVRGSLHSHHTHHSWGRTSVLVTNNIFHPIKSSKMRPRKQTQTVNM